MGLWLELIVLALCAYIAGIGVGWLLWARTPRQPDSGDGKE